MVHSDFSHEGSGSAMVSYFFNLFYNDFFLTFLGYEILHDSGFQGWSQSSSVDPQDPAHAREIERLRTENAQLKVIN